MAISDGELFGINAVRAVDRRLRPFQVSSYVNDGGSELISVLFCFTGCRTAEVWCQA